MGSIGSPELVVMGVIFAMLVAVPLLVVLVILKVVRKTAAAPGLVPCRACGRAVSARAGTCPHCGEPRVALGG